MIPDSKQQSIERALFEAFGVDEYEDIRPVTGGQSPSLVFQIVVHGKPYLLRLIMRSEQIADPRVELACMKTAAEVGIAPRIWYANLEDKVLITDFLEAKPFPDDMSLRLGPLLRRLHSLPGFPKPKMGSYIDSATRFVQKLQTANLLPDKQADVLFRRYSEIITVYPQDDSDLVASHNDLKLQNIRFDGERIWLIDWESAFLNDPFVDLAVAANFFVNNKAEEEMYLRAYLGRPPSGYERARFFLVRQVVSMFYIAFLSMMVARSGKSIDENVKAPDFREFHRRLIADEGEAYMATDEGRLEYANVHLNEVLRNMQSREFEDAIAQVKKGRPVAERAERG